MGIRRALKKFRQTRAKSTKFFDLSVNFSSPQYTWNIKEHLFHGVYEIHEIKGLQAVVKPTDAILELGTGLGIITSLAARAAPHGRVLSYEANPDLVDDARNLISANGILNTEVRHGVLTKNPTNPTTVFHIASSFAESSLHPMSDAVKAIDVPTHDLDSVLSEFCPDVLICDIEGAEANFIPQVNLENVRAAVVELHPHLLKDVEIAGIYNHFMGKNLYPRIEHSGGTVVVFERLDL